MQSIVFARKKSQSDNSLQKKDKLFVLLALFDKY